jgi:hypothetical protein
MFDSDDDWSDFADDGFTNIAEPRERIADAYASLKTTTGADLAVERPQLENAIAALQDARRLAAQTNPADVHGDHAAWLRSIDSPIERLTEWLGRLDTTGRPERRALILRTARGEVRSLHRATTKL